MAARALGGRDLALAVGPLLAMRHKGPARGWIEAAMLADATDTMATLLAFGKLPRLTRWLVLGACAGAVAAGIVVSASLDAEDTGGSTGGSRGGPE